MKPETKKIFVREWMSLFGSFWAACLSVLLFGAWIYHQRGSLPGDKEMVAIILYAWLGIYAIRLAVMGVILVLRKNT